MVTIHELKHSYDSRTDNWRAALTAKLAELDLPSKSLLRIMSEAEATQTLPYHGFKHLLNVAFDAEFIAAAEGTDLPSRQAAFLAGLFHDYNHTGCGSPDSPNIQLAVAKFTEVCGELHEAGVPGSVLSEAACFIQATNMDCGPTYFEKKHRLIRDADLLAYCYMPFEELADGLSTEIGVTVTEESTRSFLSQHGFVTGSAELLMRDAGWV